MYHVYSPTTMQKQLAPGCIHVFDVVIKVPSPRAWIPGTLISMWGLSTSSISEVPVDVDAFDCEARLMGQTLASSSTDLLPQHPMGKQAQKGATGAKHRRLKPAESEQRPPRRHKKEREDKRKAAVAYPTVCPFLVAASLLHMLHMMLANHPTKVLTVLTNDEPDFRNSLQHCIR